MVYREVFTEARLNDEVGQGSETAKVGTDEQKLDKRHDKSDEISHHINVQIPKLRESICHVDSAAIDRRKMLLPGEVSAITGW